MTQNNLFQYATKELSQDAILCWMINWINYPDSPLHSLGIDALNLFLGNSTAEYFNVEVKRQYKKIDVLILFNDDQALIIEDKTNSSEHSDQIRRYQELIKKDFPNRNIHTAYIKTGIIYDEDACILEKSNVITLDDLLSLLHPYANKEYSNILEDYFEYIVSLANERYKIDEYIDSCKYTEALKTRYGQYSFMNRIFSNRSKRTSLGQRYTDSQNNSPVYIDSIYAGTNNGGTPWTQYCFWGEAYPTQMKNTDEIEYHYLFWRIDCNWRKDSKEKYVAEFYIALRHYDCNAKFNQVTKDRKKEAYKRFRPTCQTIEENNSTLFKKLGTRENYKESDLLFIPISNLENMTIDKIQKTLNIITESVRRL